MRAIILCAGMGTRMYPFTNTTHKALVPIQGIPLIEYTLKYLNSHHITDITLVTGDKAEHFEYLKEKYNVEIRVSTQYQTHNNHTSMQLVLDKMEDCIVMDGDIYIKEDFVPLIDTTKNQYFTQPISHGTEWGLTLDKNNQIIDIDTAATEGYGLISISYWKGDLTPMLKEELNKCTVNEYWDDANRRLSKTYPIYANPLALNSILEFDSTEELLYSGLLSIDEVLSYIKLAELSVDTLGMSNKSYYNDDIFIKVYSPEVSKVVDRKKELQFKEIFYKLGLTPKSLAETDTYSIAEHFHGEHPKLKDEECIQRCIKALEPVHQTKLNQAPDLIMNTVSSFLSACSDDTETHEDIHDLIKNNLDLFEPSVCHGDLMIGNILTDKDGKIQFIDFEYCCYRSKYWDIVALYVILEVEVPNDLTLLGFAVARCYFEYAWAMMAFHKEEHYEYGMDGLQRALKYFTRYKELLNKSNNTL